MDNSLILRDIETLYGENDFLAINYLGENVIERRIPMIILGNGKKQILYVGNQSDSRVSAALLRFTKEYLSLLEGKSKIFGLPIEYVASKVSIGVIPNLALEENNSEIGVLCNFLRFSEDLVAVIEFCGRKDNVLYKSNLKNYRTATALSKMLDFPSASKEDPSICSWYQEQLCVPCFSVGCGANKNEKKDFFDLALYTRIRKTLFCAPMLF